MKRMQATLSALAFAFLLTAGSLAVGDDKVSEDKAGEDNKTTPSADAGQEALEKQFAELLTGSQLIGHYTLWGKEDAPKRDTYTLEKVSKLKDDYWLFLVRIKYGKNDIKVPLTLRVKWAGDTPVITVDKVLVPGLGTFSARVVFQGNQYAATWDGGDHGGHMFGKVVKIKAEKDGQNGDGGQKK